MTSGNSDTGQRSLASISPFFIAKDLQTSIAHYIEPLSPLHKALALATKAAS